MKFLQTVLLSFVQGFKLSNHLILKGKIKSNGFKLHMKPFSIEESMEDGNSFLHGLYFSCPANLKGSMIYFYDSLRSNCMPL